MPIRTEMADLSLWFVRPHYDEFFALYNNDIAHLVQNIQIQISDVVVCFRTIYKLHTVLSIQTILLGLITTKCSIVMLKKLGLTCTFNQKGSLFITLIFSTTGLKVHNTWLYVGMLFLPFPFTDIKQINNVLPCPVN